MAEAIGTGAIIGGGCGAVCAATFVPGYALGPLGCSLAFGSSVALAVYATRDISGAHLNPAITAMLVVHRPGAISNFDAACYVGAQLTGGVFAAVRHVTARPRVTDLLGLTATHTLSPRQESHHTAAGFPVGLCPLGQS
jgi:glycerol uptake facilitator-like aquaporin